MNGVVTPDQVVNRLVALSREYDAVQQRLEDCEMAYANAKSLWEITSARTRLGIQARALDANKRITVQERDDEAVVRCQDELTALNIAEAHVRIARADATRLKTQIDIARSVGTSVRAAIDLV